MIPWQVKAGNQRSTQGVPSENSVRINMHGLTTSIKCMLSGTMSLALVVPVAALVFDWHFGYLIGNGIYGQGTYTLAVRDLALEERINMNGENVIKSAVGFCLVILLGSLISAITRGGSASLTALISPEFVSGLFTQNVEHGKP